MLFLAASDLPVKNIFEAEKESMVEDKSHSLKYITLLREEVSMNIYTSLR